MLLIIKHLIVGGGNKVFSFFVKHSFAKCGKNVHFSPLNSDFTYKTIAIGNDVFIGPHAIFRSIQDIIIGNKVMFGPHVTIVGGDHNYREVGQFMFDVKQKRDGDDLPVIIEDDTWIGCNAVILKGVRVGRGAIVGAGTIVSKDVPPYTIVAGNPARIIRYRFDEATIKEHERILGI